jgi:hypothetical protein
MVWCTCCTAPHPLPWPRPWPRAAAQHAVPATTQPPSMQCEPPLPEWLAPLRMLLQVWTGAARAGTCPELQPTQEPTWTANPLAALPADGDDAQRLPIASTAEAQTAVHDRAGASLQAWQQLLQVQEEEERERLLLEQVMPAIVTCRCMPCKSAKASHAWPLAAGHGREQPLPCRPHAPFS